MPSVDPNPYSAPAPVADLAPAPLPYAGSILRQGWRVFAGNWITLATLIALVWIPVAIVTSYLVDEVFGESSLLSLTMIPVEFLTEALGTGAVIAVAISAGIGREPSVHGALRTSSRVWLKFAWTYFLYTLLFLLGIVAFVLPGLFVAVRMSLTDSVVVNEGAWGLTAIRRSVDLTRGKFWSLAVLYSALVLLSIFSWIAYSIALELFPAISTWQTDVLFSWVINMIEAYPSICLYLVYRRSLREENRFRSPSVAAFTAIDSAQEPNTRAANVDTVFTGLGDLDGGDE